MFGMEKCCDFFEVQTESLNIIYMSFGFNGLNCIAHYIISRYEHFMQIKCEYIFHVILFDFQMGLKNWTCPFIRSLHATWPKLSNHFQ
jgi:hypothetical protein